MNLNYLYLILAMALLFSGHIVRIIRWEYFINIYEKPEKGSLYRGLFFGYLFNMIFPFHLGEFIRAYVAGRKMKNGHSFSLVTVIIDRYLDIIYVGFIFLVLLCFDYDNKTVLRSSIAYVGMSLFLVVITLVVFSFSSAIKKITKAIASIFNENIEYHILGFVFSAINGFKDLFINLSKIKVLGSGFIMWGLYLLSYYVFALFLRSINRAVSLKEVFIGLFSNFNVTSFTQDGLTSQLYLFVFLIVPNIVLLIIGLIMKSKTDNGEAKNVLPLMRREERLQFLEEYFGNKRREFLTEYIKLNRDVTILRDYSAGSNASTMLCAADDATFFRKFAFGDDAKTLKRQCEWILQHDDLKLPKVINQYKSDDAFLYDMPYTPSVMTLFQYVHAAGPDAGFEILMKIICDLKKNLYVNKIKADPGDYVHNKVTLNLKKLSGYKKFQKLSENATIIINGTEYNNLKHYSEILNEEYLNSVLLSDEFSEGHGDLTLENIIVDNKDYYLIDPNPITLLGGMYLDLGKILQSVHSQYEFRRLVGAVETKGNSIDFFMTSSHAYHELYEKFDDYLKNNYSVEQRRAIYTHEIIHYLRLLPYRIESANFAVFYAAFIILLSEYEKMWR